MSCIESFDMENRGLMRSNKAISKGMKTLNMFTSRSLISEMQGRIAIR